MKVNETKIDKFLATNETIFAIPVYQRNYDWTKSQCTQLLNDVLQVGRNTEINAHFIGSIVHIHDDVYTTSGITELTIIDGQQRLTTITLIYVALYQFSKEIDNQALMNRIHKTYLVNEFANEAEKLKLKPTDNNKEALRYILESDNENEFRGYSRIIENFRFFKLAIDKSNYDIIMRGLSKLIFVEVSLDRQRDNPQRIFESLNSTGLELSQADLIRNYILMGLSIPDQSRIYKSYWENIEKNAKDESLNKSKVSDFIRDYLTLKNKEIPNKGDVYFKFKTQFPTSTINNLEDVLKELKSLVKYYNKLVNPKNESDQDIRIQLEYIGRLEINVAYPFLMKVYEDFSEGAIDKQIFISILSLVQSFTWRRFILGLPTNALNKIFMSLYEKVEKDNYLFSIQKSLLQRSGIQRFPRNEEIRKVLKIKDLYNVKPKNRTYLLDRLENFDNKERVIIEGNTNITVEHIFPQRPDATWLLDLKEEYKFIEENYVNTIANLTLSGNNSRLGNKSFIFKRDLNPGGYKDSRLWLNKYLSTIDKWDKTEIEKRAVFIYKRFLKIWEIPNIDVESETESNEINIFDAEDPTHKKLEYAIFLNRRLDITQVSKLYTEILKILFEAQPETFFTSEMEKRIVLTQNKNELRQSFPLGDSYFMETNYDSSGKFERIKHTLEVFGIEDELSIKYAS